MFVWSSLPTALISRFEACDGALVFHSLAGQHFERDDFFQFGVQRLVDRAHAAFADLGEQLVLAEAAEL